MKKLESSLLNMVLVLTGVAVMMGGILAYVNHLTSDPISQQKEKALTDGIKAVMRADVTPTSTDTIPAEDGKNVYIVYNNEKGAAVQSTTMGFGGDLKVLVGFDKDGNILGYTLLEHAETPGLGAKADKWFQEGGKGSIIGKTPGEKPFGVSKDKKGEEQPIDAITASTITSRAFLLAVNNAYKTYMKTSANADTK
ncbi:MAG: RnfABCDGE type electron transport complex subunit G [Prevotella sp.]|nr:RnfABCDGE type electron transport complex subunit G [Prevotella sp.]